MQMIWTTEDIRHGKSQKLFKNTEAKRNFAQYTEIQQPQVVTRVEMLAEIFMRYRRIGGKTRKRQNFVEKKTTRTGVF